jgi:hypothetical protein
LTLVSVTEPVTSIITVIIILGITLKSIMYCNI